MKQKKIRPVWPIYIFGLTWLLVFAISGSFRHLTWVRLIIVIMVSMIVYLICRASAPVKYITVEEPATPADTGNPEVDSLIDKGRDSVRALTELNEKIKDEYISREISRMEGASRTIFDTIAEHPEKAADIRRFLNYYLPTTIKLLETYHRMDSQTVKGENVMQTMESVKSNVDMIANAFEKEADSLFSDEAMDISSDIEVMDTILKSEGLK